MAVLTTSTSPVGYVEYADRTSFDVSRMTVAAWVVFYGTAVNGCVIGRTSSSVGSVGEWSLGLDASSFIRFHCMGSGSAQAAETSYVPSTGRPYHICGTYDTDNLPRVYVDGLLENTAPSAGGGMGANALSIQVLNRITSDGPAVGCVWNIGYWNRALSADEIMALYSGVLPHFVAPDALVLADTLDAADTDVAGMGGKSLVGAIAYVPPQSRPFNSTPVSRTRYMRKHARSRMGVSMPRTSAERRRRIVIATPPPVAGPLIGPGRLVRCEG